MRNNMREPRFASTPATTVQRGVCGGLCMSAQFHPSKFRSSELKVCSSQGLSYKLIPKPTDSVDISVVYGIYTCVGTFDLFGCWAIYKRGQYMYFISGLLWRSYSRNRNYIVDSSGPSFSYLFSSDLPLLFLLTPSSFFLSLSSSLLSYSPSYFSPLPLLLHFFLPLFAMIITLRAWKNANKSVYNKTLTGSKEGGVWL